MPDEKIKGLDRGPKEGWIHKDGSRCTRRMHSDGYVCRGPGNKCIMRRDGCWIGGQDMNRCIRRNGQNMGMDALEEDTRVDAPGKTHKENENECRV